MGSWFFMISEPVFFLNLTFVAIALGAIDKIVFSDTK